MREIIRAGVVVVVACVALAAAGPALANGTSGSQAPVVLHLDVHPVASGVWGVWASGDYLLLSTTLSGINFVSSTGWMVLNERLGTTIALDPQCLLVGVGPPWALMSCPLTSNPHGSFDVELDSLVDGTRRTVTPSPGVPYCSSPPPDMETKCAYPDGVGAQWIGWDATCYHCGDTYLFQNIQTGELRGDPTNATTYADLSSPALAHRTCPGVRLIRNPYGFSGPGWGPLTPDGQFALATGGPNSVFLERCGTGMRRALVNVGVSFGVAANSGAIVWQGGPSYLSGLFLPSLQAFTIPLPAAIVTPPGSPTATGAWGLEGLTSGALYVREGSPSTIWRAASPTALPRNISGPRVTRSGRTLTCRRGSWLNAVTFSYEWRVNGRTEPGATPRLAVEARKRRSVSCSVTASNAAGTTTASSAQLRVR